MQGLATSVSAASFDGLSSASETTSTHKPTWREQNVQGVCRWISQKDALTKTVGVVVDDLSFKRSRFCLDSWLDTTQVRTVMFEETEIIRGSNIAVPNKYFGMMCGPLIMGVFDPGHPSFVGVFALMMEEATPRLSKQSSPSNTSPSRQISSSFAASHHVPVLSKTYKGLMTFANPLQRRGFHCSFFPTRITNNDTLFKGVFTIHFQAASAIEDYNGSFIKLDLIIDLTSTTIKPEAPRSRRNEEDADTIFSSENTHFKASRVASCILELPTVSNIAPVIHHGNNGTETATIEPESEEDEWIANNLPMNQSFGMYRMGDYWVAYMKEPKTGIFFIHVKDF